MTFACGRRSRMRLGASRAVLAGSVVAGVVGLGPLMASASATASSAVTSTATASSASAATSRAAAPAAIEAAVAAPAAIGALTTTEVKVPVGAEPDGTAVSLDASIVAPEDGAKHAAVLLAHGFGGSKDDLAEQASDLANNGFVVMTYSARGFGASGGRIHLNDPAYEIADARALIDTLAARDDVLLDATGDPRVGVVGGSYGGALALMSAGTDPRIDTVVAAITWNDLADSLFAQGALTSAEGATPAAASAVATPGVFKQLWASRFFASAVAGSGPRDPSPAEPSTPAPSAATGPSNPLCGRFDPTVCALMMRAAETGTPDPELLTLLHAHSPQPTLAATTAPTLLIQGQTDSLFGLDQSDANARGLAAAGAPVAIRWTDGGHDGRSTTQAQDDAATRTWLRHYLAPNAPRTGPLPVAAFTYSLPLQRRANEARLATMSAYPGLTSQSAPVNRVSIPLESNSSEGPDSGATVLTPPGGAPASTTVVPGLGALGGLGGNLPTYQLAALPGQSVAFETPPLQTGLNVVGSPRVHLSVTSTGSEVTLFASLWQVQGATASLPRPLVAPIHLRVTPGEPTPVRIALPPGTFTLAAGSQWRVLITSTDSAFSGARTARADTVSLAEPTLSLPTAEGTVLAPPASSDNETRGLLIAIAVVLAAICAGAVLHHRQRTHLPIREDLLDVPLVVDSLVKTFSDGHRAVDDVSWRAEKGQVVGLLGPNGAGKTTTMRMLLGLIKPDSGAVHILGQPVVAGAPVLGQIGALVEGPGFLPHLTGLENLHAYWRATGRPMDEAGFEEALDVAALGGALDRPVRTYSQGMRQRLGIAQAMLGRPAILFLDEPTNGLDPPQIAAMRPILQAYAATGRTVVVSSHLLAEVEQTCSHVVVMHAGKVITAGPVADLVASADTTLFEFAPDADPTPAAAALRARTDVHRVEIDPRDAPPRMTVVSDLPRAELVKAAVDAGAQIVGVGSRRQLEEVFLGVIADAQSDDAGGSHGGTLVERLRQVRAR